jgi:hypothetical protein
MQLCPLALLGLLGSVQSMHPVPHAVGVFCVWHVWVDAQQVPPPHGVFALHAEVQLPPPATGLHVGVPFVQALHACPSEPHAPALVPGVHVPLRGSQHPPLHGVSVAPPHACVHWLVNVSHAYPAGQSVCFVQPQAPFTHAVPNGSLRQLLQVEPQAPGPHATQALLTQHVPPPHAPSFA